MDAHAAAKAALAGQELKAKPLDVATWVGPGLKASLASSADLALDALRSAKEGVRTNHTALAHRGSILNNALQTAAGVAEAEVLFYVTPKPLVVPAPEATGPTSNTSVALAQGGGGTAYANMRLRYRNTKYNGERPGPASFYMPSTPKGLAETITDLNAASTRWVVRSGGHSYETNSLPPGTEAGDWQSELSAMLSGNQPPVGPAPPVAESGAPPYVSTNQILFSPIPSWSRAVWRHQEHSLCSSFIDDGIL